LHSPILYRAGILFFYKQALSTRGGRQFELRMKFYFNSPGAGASSCWILATEEALGIHINHYERDPMSACIAFPDRTDRRKLLTRSR